MYIFFHENKIQVFSSSMKSGMREVREMWLPNSSNKADWQESDLHTSPPPSYSPNSRYLNPENVKVC